MSRIKTKGYEQRDIFGTNVRQTGRTGHSLESCPTVRLSEDARLVVEAHDLVAREMESKWGVDRLERLVDETLGKKFLTARDRFNAAIAANDDERIQKLGAQMKRAWIALDEEATRSGAKPLDPTDFWEMRHQQWTVRLVRSVEEMPKEQPEGVVYLAAEELLAFVPGTVLEIKRHFAGAKVTDIEPKDKTPNDPIPF